MNIVNATRNASAKQLPVLVLSGPTGSGKSSFVYQHLTSYPLEIIGCDARQIYRDMQIGTASPSKEDLQKLPHHLFNFLSPAEKFSAGEFCQQAKTLIKQIHERKKIPLILGGTFFYIKSLWDGLVQEPKCSPDLIAYVESLSAKEIRMLLKVKDSLAFARIQEKDSYRNQRALLLSLAAEKPFSSLPQQRGIFDDYRFYAFFIQEERELLYQKINRRTQKMFAEGLLQETAILLQKDFGLDSPGLNTIGYKEILQLLQNKSIVDNEKYMKTSVLIKTLQNLSRKEISECRDLIAQKTRNYAKRQLTWFRHQPRLTPFSLQKKQIFFAAVEQAKLDIASSF